MIARLPWYRGLCILTVLFITFVWLAITTHALTAVLLHQPFDWLVGYWWRLRAYWYQGHQRLIIWSMLWQLAVLAALFTWIIARACRRDRWYHGAILLTFIVIGAISGNSLGHLMFTAFAGLPLSLSPFYIHYDAMRFQTVFFTLPFNFRVGGYGLAVFSYIIGYLGVLALGVVFYRHLYLKVIAQHLTGRLCIVSPKHKQKLQPYGGATWADVSYLKQTQLCLSRKEAPGYCYGKLGRHYIGQGQLPEGRLVVAPRRTGKGVSSCMPFLLDCPHNVFALDIKGELFLTTLRHRLAIGKQPRIIDPYGVILKFAHLLAPYGGYERFVIKGINPFARVIAHPVEREQYLTGLALALIIHEKGGHNDHFIDSAKAVVAGLLAAFWRDGESLSTMYDQISALERKNIIQELEQLLDAQPSRPLQAAIGKLKKAADRELGSMLTTLDRCFQWLASDVWADFFKQDNFDFKDYVLGESDLFLVLPYDVIEDCNQVVRLLLNLWLHSITRTPKHQRAEHEYPLLLDELGQLGYSPEVERIIEVAGADRLRIMALFQSYDQINIYHKPGLFRDMPVKHFFGSDDVNTMQWIQTLGGQQTIQTESIGKSTSKSNVFTTRQQGSAGQSINHALTGVPLIQMDAIRELPANEQFIFIKGVRAIRCQKLCYYTDPRYHAKFDENPIEVIQPPPTPVSVPTAEHQKPSHEVVQQLFYTFLNAQLQTYLDNPSYYINAGQADVFLAPFAYPEYLFVTHAVFQACAAQNRALDAKTVCQVVSPLTGGRPQTFEYRSEGRTVKVWAVAQQAITIDQRVHTDAPIVKVENEDV